MADVRIRWRGVARAAAIVVVGLIALRLLPALLRAPEPPPLGADVGLPKAKPATSEPVRAVVKPEAEPEQPAAAQAQKRRNPQPTRRKVRVVADGPASTAKIGSQETRRRRPRTNRRQAAKPTPAAGVPEYVPPPPTEPTPAPLPEVAPTDPSAPGDGSEEFAPH
jgi:hypothetical protein